MFTKLASIPRWLAVISENRLWQQKESYRPFSAVALQRFISLPGLYPKVSINTPNCNNQDVTKHCQISLGWGGKTTKSLKTTVLQSYFKDQVFPKKENELQWYFNCWSAGKILPGGLGPRTRCSHISPYSKNPPEREPDFCPKDNETESEGKFTCPRSQSYNSELPFKSKLSLLSLASTTAWTQVLEDTWCVFSGAPTEVVRPTQLSLSFKKRVLGLGGYVASRQLKHVRRCLSTSAHSGFLFPHCALPQ